MATWQDIITAAQTLLQRWKRDVDFTSQIVNGPATGPTSVVNTDGGTIPTFAKTLNDFGISGFPGELANAADPAKGAAMIGEYDPYSPHTAPYLKTVSDIRNGDPISAFRFIRNDKIAGIQAGTSTYDCTPDLQAGYLSGAKKITLPVGKFLLGTSIDPGEVETEGHSMAATELVTTAGNEAFFFQTLGVNRGQVSFRNLTVTGPLAGNFGLGTSDEIPIRLSFYERVILDHVRVRYSKSASYRVTRCGDVFVNGCIAEYGARDGFMISASRRVIIANNIARHLDDDGISAHTETYEFSDDGFQAVERSIIIANNHLTDTKGIRVLGAVNTNVTGNTLLRPKEHGIWVGYTSGTANEGQNDPVGITVTDNRIFDLISGALIQAAGGQNSSTANNAIVIGSRPASVGTVAPIPAAIPGQFDYAGDVWIKPEGYWYRNNKVDDVPRTGAHFLKFRGNTIARTLPDTALYSDWGYGQVWTGVGNVNPAMSSYMRTGTAVQFFGTSSVENLDMAGNTFYGFDLGMAFGSTKHLSNVKIKDNDFIRMKSFAIDLVDYASIANLNSDGGRPYSPLEIEGNLFDLDPYLEHSMRNADGSWNTTDGTPTAIRNNRVSNYTVKNNKFRNLFSPVSDPTGFANGYGVFQDNVYIMHPTDTPATCKGIRVIVDPVGSRFMIEDSDPTSATYRQRTWDQGVMTSAAMPTAGYYMRGQFVKNSAPTTIGSGGSQYTIHGWVRRVTGNNHVLNTDWSEVRGSTGT